MRLAGVLVVAALVGCGSVGPDYVPPETKGKTPTTFRVPDKEGDGFVEVPDPTFRSDRDGLTNWWTLFNDPLLNSLIDTAAKQNLDIRIALARVNEARASLGIARSTGSPQVGVGGQAGLGGYSASVDASWELDVWGRIARIEESATAQFQATVEDKRNIQVSLCAEVAQHYLLIRSLQERLGAAERSIKAQKEIVKISKSRFKSGLSSRLVVVQAERVLATTQSNIPPLRIELAREINTLAVLVGQFPKQLAPKLETVKPLPLAPATVGVGVPSELIRQRPDIRAAERRLAAQTARVGIATADLYPTFSLNGSLGINNAGPQAFLGPSVRWTIYDGGRIKNQIKVEDARVQQEFLKYERTVLTAVQEVESSMVGFTQQRRQAELLDLAIKASREELKLGLDLYKQGLIEFMNILEAAKALFGLEIQGAQARGQASLDLVRLYKALGGGWDPTAPVPENEKADPAKKADAEAKKKDSKGP